MSVSRLSRLLMNGNLCRQFSLLNQKNLIPIVASNRFYQRSRRFDDSFFGVASNLMRSLENEFNQMRNSLLRSTSLPVPRIFEFPLEKPSTYDDLIQVDNEGNRKFELQIDLQGFEPEEINVETKGHLLTISAKKEKKSKDSYILREFSQSYSLPEDLKLEDLKSKWHNGCVLAIEAPLPKMIESAKSQTQKEKEIPIKHHSNNGSSSHKS